MTSNFESPEELAANQEPSPDDLSRRIRQAMVAEEIEHYSMSLVDSAEIAAVIEAVNIGIDARLTACYCPDRGDSYQHGNRSISATSDTKYWKQGDQLQLARTLECSVSAESLPVLLRRLEDSDQESAWSLRSAILATLGIEE